MAMASFACTQSVQVVSTQFPLSRSLTAPRTKACLPSSFLRPDSLQLSAFSKSNFSSETVSRRLPAQFPRKISAEVQSEDAPAVPAEIVSTTVLSAPPAIVSQAEPASWSAANWFTELVGSLFAQLKKPAVVAMIVAAVLLGDPSLALAAQSGGRVGGRSFGGGGGGGGASRSYSMPSRSYSSPSFSRPSYSVPYYAPSPFYYGGGWSPFSFGPTVVVGGGGGAGVLGGVFQFLFFGAVFLFIANAARGLIGGETGMLGATEKTSVVKVQVGLLGLARELQKDLERIADRADTSSSEGLHYVLTETVLTLLRHPDYCVSAFSMSEVERDVEAGEAAFNRLTLEERGKFERETLVNVGNIRRQLGRGFGGSASRMSSEYIVVTLVVAVEGQLKIPQVNSSQELKLALGQLGSLRAEQIQAVEILWTPQDENDTLSERELMTDYPQLRPL
eukprot:TRINITY_DN3557_c0_g1_i1.p1 TRINITY_DN3557_c0_g1~~TRINITY_DN3557_c0_g1_i1.p1  ORF type:complete len:448 (+),score=46.00 TRINITY_DN3557_c0_g1_i1:293-1636(+)